MILELKYGCNPHQVPARLVLPDPSPLRVLNGKPSYINILDALGAWQLARELRLATGRCGAASFKHTSPARAAIARPVSSALRASLFLVDQDLSEVATAYVRARAGDRMSSFGDVAALSDTVDRSLAEVLRREVSDLIIAPGFEPEALDILKSKKKGVYLIFQMDPDYEPPETECRELFGFRLEQERNNVDIGPALFEHDITSTSLPTEAIETLMVATIAVKYTRSNSVCVAFDGQVIGVGAGQQSRIHCTRLACDKADKWFLQQHPKTLGLKFDAQMNRTARANTVDQNLLSEQLSEAERETMLEGLNEPPDPISKRERQDWTGTFEGVCLSSDAFIPFSDNIDRANGSNVQYIAQAGQSLRDKEVTEAAKRYGMTMVHTGLRCFLH